jgi:hypothetical protein
LLVFFNSQQRAFKPGLETPASGNRPTLATVKWSLVARLLGEAQIAVTRLNGQFVARSWVVVISRGIVRVELPPPPPSQSEVPFTEWRNVCPSSRPRVETIGVIGHIKFEPNTLPPARSEDGDHSLNFHFGCIGTAPIPSQELDISIDHVFAPHTGSLKVSRMSRMQPLPSFVPSSARYTR